MADASRPESDEHTPTATLCVATVFEDQAAADCAQRLMSRILQMAGPALPVEEYSWGFHHFEEPDGLAVSARRAAAADVLVVAAYRDSPAVSRLLDWLQHWLGPAREKRGALVAVTIDPDENHLHTPSLIEECLPPIARLIDMDFFSTRVSATMDLTNGKFSPHEQ